MESELGKLAHLLENEYGMSDDGKWEITAASNEDGCWLLSVKKVSEDKGAKK